MTVAKLRDIKEPIQSIESALNAFLAVDSLQTFLRVTHRSKLHFTAGGRKNIERRILDYWWP